MPGFYEFFAGGGMVRAGLGPGWSCLYANDFDPRKAETYRLNWGRGEPAACLELHVGDVAAVKVRDLPGRADLCWASFPCQDLSLAGAGAGLEGRRSGAFHPFWALVRDLAGQGRAPRIVALENVVGALSSHRGADFAALGAALTEAGYAWGALVIDAALFTPQSRPRLFVIGVQRDALPDSRLIGAGPTGPFHPPALLQAVERLPKPARDAMVWWRLEPPPRRNLQLADLLEDEPSGVRWRSDEETAALLARMAPLHRAKLASAAASGRRVAGCAYRRMRQDPSGGRVQRWEVRFDGVAGCLRTPTGGSSRQTVLVVEGERVRSRLLSARETARLMGLGDDYRLPARYNEAYHLTGDGVVAPVVRHLAERLFEPLLAGVRAAA